MADNNTLNDFDMFFYYGQNELELETKHDLLLNLMQPKRSLFYDRAVDAAGIPNYENVPESLTLRINVPYEIVNSFGKRNQYVSNGENGTRDRRVALSQSTIRIESDSKFGNVNITVLYIPMADYKQTESFQFKVGAGA